RGLMQGLAAVDAHNEYVLCLGPDATPTFEVPNQRWRIVPSPVASARRATRLMLEQSWIPMIAQLTRADLIHSTGYTGPLASRAARITTIHDMNYKRHPEDLSTPEVLVYSALVPMVARRSHHVLTATQAGRQDVLRWTGIPASRVTAVAYGVRKGWPGSERDD